MRSRAARAGRGAAGGGPSSRRQARAVPRRADRPTGQARPGQSSRPPRRAAAAQRARDRPARQGPAMPASGQRGWPVLCHSKLRRVPLMYTALQPARGNPQPTAPLASPAVRPHTPPGPAPAFGARSPVRAGSHRHRARILNPIIFTLIIPTLSARAQRRAAPGCRAPRSACVLTSNKIRHQNARAPPGSHAAARGPHARLPAGGSKKGVRDIVFEVRCAPSRDKTPNRVWVWGLRRAVA